MDLCHRCTDGCAGAEGISFFFIKRQKAIPDPNTTSSAEAFMLHREALANKIAMVRLNYRELLSIKDCLGESRVYLSVSVKDEEEAKRAMDLVEKYR